jgi:hypothetical protein
MRRFIATIALFPALALADPGVELFREVLGSAQICAYGKGPTARQDCFVRSAPSRCEVEARSGTNFGTQGFSYFKDCVISCGAAGAWSSTVGECRRSLVIDGATAKYQRLYAMGCFNNPGQVQQVQCEFEIAAPPL